MAGPPGVRRINACVKFGGGFPLLSQLLRRAFASIGVFFRSIRALLIGAVKRVKAGFHRITDLSREAAGAAASFGQEASAAADMPSKRESYIETRGLFISKSFLIALGVALAVLALLFYFVGWPFILSHFLTARFYQGDSRVPDWSGKVIVYYDEDRKIPMYSGTLNEGILQGRGKEYDENGLIAYEGGFTDGVRDGAGAAFEAGALIYEGQFSNGLYEGAGKLYDGGELVYSGYFANGLADGLGTAYVHGVKSYEGGFSDGMYDGDGIAYYEDGTPRYKGSFSKGLYDGDGTEYNADGGVTYRGSFEAGLYNGDGTVYLPGGDSIRSKFTKGAGDGVIEWYKSGRVWYSGGAADLTPDGFGTIYASNGKVIYAGEMDMGTLDGGWLLGLTVEELRTAFGEASVTETGRDSGGFLIGNNDLALTVLCAYRDGDNDVRVHRIWLLPEAGSDGASLLPWAGRAQAEAWAVMDRDPAPRMRRTQGAAYLPTGGIGGDWYQSVVDYEGYSMALAYRLPEAAPFEIIWAQPGGLDITETETADPSTAQARERMDSLLEALDETGGSGGGAGAAAGSGDVERLLELMSHREDACDLIDALTDYYVYGQAMQALEANRPLLEQNLAERQTLLDRGQSSQSAVDSARDRVNALDLRVATCRTAREKARLIGENLTGEELESADLAEVLLIFDPSALDFQALYDAAVEYARSVAAGRYEADEREIEINIKTLILDLNLAYENLLAGRRALEASRANLEAAEAGYTVGIIDMPALNDSLCALNEQIAALTQTMGDFTRLANRLNDASGGWLARDQGWLEAAFAVIFEGEILRGETQAEAERRQAAEDGEPGDGPAGPGGGTAMPEFSDDPGHPDNDTADPD